MALTVEIIKMAQSILVEKGFNIGTVDGVAGSNTSAALDKIKDLDAGWSTDRKIIGLIQLYAKGRGIDPGKIDGFWGPRTQEAFDQLKHQLLFGHTEAPWRPEEVVVATNPNNWPLQTQKAMSDFYGAAKPNGNNNLVTVDVPYQLHIPWAGATNKITCHKKVKDSLLRVLNTVLNEYGLQRIHDLRLDIFGGCFNYRLMRGGTQLSTHSWGIALDFDPANNQLKWGRDKALFAKPDYIKWWEAWEKEGWVSLGRQRNYDWMHVQAAKLNS